MLARLRIRQKLAVLLVIPLVAVALVMAALAAERISDARDSATTAEAALAARDIGGLIQTLQRERLLALGYLVVPTLQRSAIVGQSQTAIAETARLAADPRTAEIIQRAQTPLQALGGIRAQVAARDTTPDTAYNAYVSAIFALMQSLNLSDPQVADPDGVRELLALDSLMRSNEEASSAGAMVIGAAVEPEFTTVRLLAAVSADGQHLQRFRALAATDQTSLVDGVQAGDAANRLREHIVAVTRGETLSTEEVSDALAAALTYTGLRRLAQDRVARDAALGAQRDAEAATRTAAAVVGGAVLLFLAVVALAVTVSQSISTPLRRLGRAVGAVAELSRAELVRVADSEALDSAPPELASVEVDTHDEIGDLAAAVNRVQSTAAMLLERQVTARANVATMFANVSRRTKNLVGRQLHMIEEIGRHSPDPATKERLSQLEHVTTRLRRSADSLLVVSGTVDQQLSTIPSRLRDVMDSALAEIEGFDKVEIVEPLPDVAVPADLSGDLKLLLAELLENATNFTPPGSSVRIGAVRDQADGARPASYAPDLTITIVDEGLGMSPARIEEENRRLVERERLDVAPTRVLGLFVVGRLARRHGLGVRLGPSPGRGITATIRVPARLLSPGSVPAAVAGLGVVPPLAVAALESATRSGPFPWLATRSGPAAIGAAPVSSAPVTGAPVGAASAGSSGGRSARNPEAERDALDDYLSGVERGTRDAAKVPAAYVPAAYIPPAYVPPAQTRTELPVSDPPVAEPPVSQPPVSELIVPEEETAQSDHRPTPAERHQ